MEIVDTSVLPRFEAMDYINSSKPYEFLYALRDDKFKLSQMRERMKAQASACGVKGFIGLWNAYLETMQKKSGLKVDNATAFDGQEVELLSGAYVCAEDGVFVSDKHGYEVSVCRHPIMPVQRLVNIDTGEEHLKIAYKKGRVWRSIIVEKAVLASSNSILQLAANGIMVNSENAKSLSTYILELEQLNYNEIDEQKSVGRCGWVGENKFSPYVDELVFDGSANFKHSFEAIKEQGEFDKWLETMRKLRAEKTAGRFFLAASFASVLLEPCGLLPFFFHAWGGTETGKTVGLMIAASVWASPKVGEYITTFNSTLVGQEMTATFLNNLPMCIDELQIQAASGARDFDKIIYHLTEGTGKTRGTKTGGLQRQNVWHNCFITNGEHPISSAHSGGGAVNRIIEMECEEKIYTDLVGMCEVIRTNYGFAGKMFVEYLQNDGVIEQVRELQRAYYSELLKTNSTEKQAASASVILTADALVTDLLFKDDNGITVEDMAEIMTKREDVDINARALEYIHELVERNFNRFRKNSFGDYTGEIWGEVTYDGVYIIKSVFDKEMSDAGFNSSAFLSWAKRNEIIGADPGRTTKRHRINGTQTRCVYLLKEGEKWESLE